MMKNKTRISFKFKAKDITEAANIKFDEIIQKNSIDLSSISHISIKNIDDDNYILIIKYYVDNVARLTNICKKILAEQFNVTEEKWFLKIDVNCQKRFIYLLIDNDTDGQYAIYFAERKNSMEKALYKATHFRIKVELI